MLVRSRDWGLNLHFLSQQSRRWEVRILDLDGNVPQQLGINKDGSFLFTLPYYITVSQSEKKIFVSDYNTDTVTCMTMDNHVIYQYNILKHPEALYCDGGDNILVCCQYSNNIQVIIADGKKHCDIVSRSEGLKMPCSISYSQSEDTLLIACQNSNHVSMFKLGK